MTTEPNTITFHNSNVEWVMRITADRRIEVNEDVEVTEAAQKVLDAMQYLLKAQRTWVDLTDEDRKQIKRKANYHWEMTTGEYAERIGELTEAKLKELNT